MLHGADKPRSRSPHGAPDDGDGNAAKEISALVAEQIEKALPDMSNQMCKVVLGTFTPIIGNTISQQVATQIAPLQQQITETNTKVDELGTSVKALVAKFDHLGLPSGGSAPPVGPSSQSSAWGPSPFAPPRGPFVAPPSAKLHYT